MTTTKLAPGAKIHFTGIGGTGMASVAGLCLEAGYRVSGSDAGVYPPTSLMLAELGIEVLTPYAPENLAKIEPDLIVVANVLSRGNPEVEQILADGRPYTSFPALLEDYFLPGRIPAVVAGTHGKTTTSSLLAFALAETGQEPGFFIGGLPRNFPRSFRLAKEGKVFVLEGDEYDTAFFDKGPKFLHYRPQYLILNNIEYDHADIYRSVEEIEHQFGKLVDLVQDPSCIIANMDDPGARRVIEAKGLADRVTKVATLGVSSDCQFSLESFSAKAVSPAVQVWTARIRTPHWGMIEVETTLSGRHMLANVCQVVACLAVMADKGAIDPKAVTAASVAGAIKEFKSVRRRLDHLASGDGIDVYEDFGHHPTAIRHVLEGFRQVFPNRRLLVAFEPRSAIQRRKVFLDDYVRVLGQADGVYIGELYVDKRIPEDERMDVLKLQAEIGSKAKCFPTNAELLNSLRKDLRSGDAVIFLSSASFSGIQYELAREVAARGG